MYICSIIGAGQLGSRHLQALALLESPIKINVVDPSQENLLMAKKRFEQINGYYKHSTSYFSSIDEIQDLTNDLVIIATNAQVRFSVLDKILCTLDVENLILEKVLFQQQSDYNKAHELLASTNSKAYVNCPRRLQSFYKKVKDSLKNRQSLLRLEVIGNNWGLGCNGIHFIDLFEFLTGETVSSWQNDLDKSIFDSKRKGFKEFSGWVYGRSNTGNTISMGCFKEGYINVVLRITTANKRFTIYEGLNKYFEEDLSKTWNMGEGKLEMAFQSNLTNKVVQSLIDSNQCLLTSYDVSKSLHVPFIQLLLQHYNAINGTEELSCPIT